jgi:SAM-dependent methyltransferase
MKLKREEVIHCAVCGVTLTPGSDRVIVTDPYGVSDEWFYLIRCRQCSTWVQTPRPVETEMDQFYAQEMWPELTPAHSVADRAAVYLRDLHLYWSEVRWLMKWLAHASTFCDYSTGDGQVIRQVRRLRRDVAVYATEYSPTFRAWLASTVPDVEVKPSLTDLDPALQFDVISAFGVLEHVPEPRRLLDELRERLVPGGKLLLMVPNPDSLQRWLSGSRWWGWYAPRHMFLMNRRALEGLLVRSGFEVVERKRFLLRYSTSMLVSSLIPRLAPAKVGRLGMVLFGILHYTLLPLELLSALFDASGFIGVVAVKLEPES